MRLILFRRTKPVDPRYIGVGVLESLGDFRSTTLPALNLYAYSCLSNEGLVKLNEGAVDGNMLLRDEAEDKKGNADVGCRRLEKIIKFKTYHIYPTPFFPF